MKKLYFIITALLIYSHLATAQNPLQYKNDREELHLLGKIQIQDFQNDTSYNKWYAAGYEEYKPFSSKPEWAKNLKNTKIKIFMGTWCGDSQEWVPQFIKLWDELGLKRDQLEVIALSDRDEDYKQGPNGEEKGWNIHRVPTFIFLENGKEYARIVESPSTDLLTDVAQIALAYPSAPNYAGATYLLNLFEEKTMEEIYPDMNNIWRTLYYKVGRYAELNTLGNVLYAAGEKEKALFVFNLNTTYYSGNWRVQNRFAELLEEMENYETALIFYEKVTQLNPKNDDALTAVDRVKKLKEEKEAKELKETKGAKKQKEVKETKELKEKDAQ